MSSWVVVKIPDSIFHIPNKPKRSFRKCFLIFGIWNLKFGIPSSASSEDGPRSCEFHYSFHLIFVQWQVTMLRAVPAFGFWIQGTFDPHDNSMAQKSGTLVAQTRSLHDLCRYPGIAKSERLQKTMTVMRPAVDGKKPDQFVGITLDLDRIGC